MIWIVAALLGLTAPQPDMIEAASYEESLSGLNASFVAVEAGTGRSWVMNPDQAEVRHAPFSSFKIPNLVILIETGAAPQGLETPIPWDAVRRPPGPYWSGAWKRDQSLESAFRRSAAWAFSDLSLAVDNRVYRQTLFDWSYGDADAPDGDDAFWLNGELSVSPREQAAFLSALASDELDVEPDTLNALRRVARAETGAGYALYGKTGLGPLLDGEYEDWKDGPFGGWYVGWVDRDNQPPVGFALYVEGGGAARLQPLRQPLARRILTDIGVLPSAD